MEPNESFEASIRRLFKTMYLPCYSANFFPLYFHSWQSDLQSPFHCAVSVRCLCQRISPTITSYFICVSMYLSCFFFKCAILGLFFRFYFRCFKQTLQFLQQRNVKKCSSRIRCWDSNPRLPVMFLWSSRLLWPCPLMSYFNSPI